nr:MAG TPA: hypothetical protein [Caudoviricetes sp.]
MLSANEAYAKKLHLISLENTNLGNTLSIHYLCYK